MIQFFENMPYAGLSLRAGRRPKWPPQTRFGPAQIAGVIRKKKKKKSKKIRRLGRDDVDISSEKYSGRNYTVLNCVGVYYTRCHWSDH